MRQVYFFGSIIYNVSEKNHLLQIIGEGDELALTILNRKQVKLPVELKSSKTIILEGTHLSSTNDIRMLNHFKFKPVESDLRQLHLEVA